MLHISYKGLLNKLKKWEVDELGGASGPPTPVSDGQDMAASERLWKPRVAAGSTTSS
jgi:hypothetical protein